MSHDPPTRIAGFRHCILHTRAAYRLLHAGHVGPAIYEFGAAKHHHGFMVGLVERGKASLAAELLRRELHHLGQALERAVAPRAAIPGYVVMEPILEALAPLGDVYGLEGEEADNVAAAAAAEIIRCWDVRDRA